MSLRQLAKIALCILVFVAFLSSAHAWRLGSSGPALSKRVAMNLGQFPQREFAFINHIKASEQWGPVGSSYATGVPFQQSVDSNGYPNVASANGRAFGAGVWVPSSLNFTGPYVLSWTGQGRVFFNNGTWTLNAGASTNCTQVSTNKWTGTDAYCVLTFSGSVDTTSFLFGLNVDQTDSGGVGAYLTNLKFYRLEDEFDLLAGKVFRTPWKRTIVNFNPSNVRFMNWGFGQNNSPLIRWESRTKPSYVTYNAYNWTASPPYAETSGTNQLTLSAVSGTPSAMQQGELVTTRIGSGMQRAGYYNITAMTKDATGGVATYTLGAAASDPSNGDVIIFYRFTSGMTQLQYRKATVSAVNTSAKSFKTDIDTSGFSTLTSAGRASAYISLNVGGRGEYPVIFMDGTTPAANYGNYLPAQSYTTFVFDKTLTALTDSSGASVYGVWLFPDYGSKAFNGGYPIEVQVALINELNDMMPIGTINAYLTLPHMSLLSMDPDYSEASDPSINTVRTVFYGANGYKGLIRGNLFLEYSNETWNAGGSAFNQTYYLARKGQLRWPSSGEADYVDMHSLRSYIAMKTITQLFGNYPRLKRVMAGQGAQGWSGLNTGRANGGSYFLADPLVVSGDTPMTYHDGFVVASYIYAQNSWMTGTMPGLATAWDAAGRPSSSSQIDSMVTALSTTAIGGSQTLESYLTIAGQMATGLNGISKFAGFYEGGWDTNITNYTSTQNAFLLAVRNSNAWATAITGYYASLATISNSYFPSEYIELDIGFGSTQSTQWGHAFPSLYGSGNSLYPSGTEGSGLNPAWLAIGAFNQAQSP